MGEAARLRRRAVLVAALGAGLAGCGVNWSAVRLDTTPTPSPPVLDVDDLTRYAAIATVTTLAAQLGSAQAEFPAETRAALLALHERQLTELGTLPGAVPTPSATPAGWPTSTPASPAVIDGPGLVAAESAAAASLLAGVGPLSAGLARLLTSIATSCAAIAVSLARSMELPEPQLPEPQIPGPAPVAPGALASPSPGQSAGPGTTATAPPTAQSPTDLVADPAAVVAALVTAERQAAFGYGPIAARLGDGDREHALSLLAEHTRREHRILVLAKAARVELPVPAAGYAVPELGDATAARDLAARLEAACAVAGCALVGVPAWRDTGVQASLRAGVAQCGWSNPIAFPGLPDL